jgi:hydrogenase maturation factor HypE
VIAACRGAGVDCAAIGRVTDASQGVSLVTGGHARPMPTFPQDEITRIFSEG